MPSTRAGVVLLHGHGRRGASLGRLARAAEVAGPVHFVAHSLGGLVARALLARPHPWPAGRLVMLGPPNAGSEWADLLFALRLDRLILGAIGAHLRTERSAADEALLGGPAEGIGIVAGTRALDPLFPRLVLRGPNDGKVTVASTRLAGAGHLVLPVSHTLMVYDREVARQAMWFLEHGRFDRAGGSGEDSTAISSADIIIG